MKKKLLLLVLLLFPLSINAIETTDQLLIDIQINEDGSALVKEIATLEGSYNGRLRDISFTNPTAPVFDKNNPDFSGNSLYNASGITNIKVGDISYKKKYTFDDFKNVNKYYKLRERRENYGVYELTKSPGNLAFKIYNNTKNAFYLEYLLTDVILVHNDIAEFAWNLIGDTYEENINNLNVRITLPKADESLRAWLHGTLESYGAIKLVDNLKVEIIYQSLGPFNPVSVRMIFNPDLVSQASKKSGINAHEGILTYEQQQADIANAIREKNARSFLDDLNNKLKKLKETLDANLYFEIYKLTPFLDEESQEYFHTELSKLVSLVDNQTKKEYDQVIQKLKWRMTNSLHKKALGLNELFIDQDLKNTTLLELNDLEKKVEKAFVSRVIIFFILFISSIVYLARLIFLNKKDNNNLSSFDHDYYRDFPSDDEASDVEYLMKHSVSKNSFSAAILNLITKKVITVEKLGKKDSLLIKNEKPADTEGEKIVMEILFNLIGDGEKVSLSQFKNYSNVNNNSTKLLKQYKKFNTLTTNQAKDRKFYKAPNNQKIKINLKILLVFIVLVLYCLWIEFYAAIIGFPFLLIVLLIINSSIFLRSEEGVDLHKKWSAHKNFLKDFSSFPEKELPEIYLWDKYLVYATVLGVATKLQKDMKIKIKEMNVADPTFSTRYSNYIILDQLLNNNVAQSINRTVQTSYLNTVYASQSSASGGGFGGGSSGGGGSFGGGGGGGRF